MALEQRRQTVQSKIIYEPPLLGMPQCEGQCVNYDAQLMKELSEVFDCPFWPPRLHNEMSTKRGLEILRARGSLSREDPACARFNNRYTVFHHELVGFAEEVEAECYGLCVFCVEEDRDRLHMKCLIPEHA